MHTLEVYLILFFSPFFLRGLSFFHGTYYCYLTFQEAVIKRQQGPPGLKE